VEHATRLSQWALEYGNIFSLKLFNTTVVVLSSYEEFRQIIDKNSALTSDRPPMHFAKALEGKNNNLALLVLFNLIVYFPEGLII
jgi:hypothetical protein